VAASTGGTEGTGGSLDKIAPRERQAGRTAEARAADAIKLQEVQLSGRD
jgi:hypothetical protein